MSFFAKIKLTDDWNGIESSTEDLKKFNQALRDNDKKQIMKGLLAIRTKRRERSKSVLKKSYYKSIEYEMSILKKYAIPLYEDADEDEKAVWKAVKSQFELMDFFEP